MNFSEKVETLDEKDVSCLKEDILWLEIRPFLKEMMIFYGKNDESRQKIKNFIQKSRNYPIKFRVCVQIYDEITKTGDFASEMLEFWTLKIREIQQKM